MDWQIEITHFSDAWHPAPSGRVMGWPELCRLMSTVPIRGDIIQRCDFSPVSRNPNKCPGTAPLGAPKECPVCGKEMSDDKRPLPLWSPATYKPGAKRGLANVQSVTAVVLDFDDGTPIAKVHEAWADWPHVIHTSWSHTPWVPKFRLVVPLETPRPPEEWPRIWHWANNRTPSDIACKDASRAYFLPAIREAGWDFEALVHDEPSRFLDVVGAELPETPEEVKRRAIANRPKPRISAGAATRHKGDLLKTDEDARRAAAERVGAATSADGARAIKAPCPKCGRASVYWYFVPGSMAGCKCQHEKSCGWSGWIDQLAGMG